MAALYTAIRRAATKAGLWTDAGDGHQFDLPLRQLGNPRPAGMLGNVNKLLVGRLGSRLNRGDSRPAAKIAVDSR